MVVIDVLPCLSVDERKLIWSKAYNGTIKLVQLLSSLRQVTFDKSQDIRNT